MNSPGTCVLPGIDPQLGSAMYPGTIFCSVQVALVLLSSGMGHPVPLLFSELLLACTMAPVPSTCGVRWGKLPVEYGLYSLFSTLKVDLIPSCLERLTFCSMEPALVLTVSSSLSSAVQKLPLYRPFGAFCPPNIVSARVPKLSCLISPAFCCGVQDALLSGLCASYLYCPQASFGA